MKALHAIAILLPYQNHIVLTYDEFHDLSLDEDGRAQGYLLDGWLEDNAPTGLWADSLVEAEEWIISLENSFSSQFFRTDLAQLRHAVAGGSPWEWSIDENNTLRRRGSTIDLITP